MAKVNPLIVEAERLGWTVQRGSKHWKLRHNVTGKTTILPYGSKMSDRSLKNVRARLKVFANQQIHT
jgi:hypothetical protein